MDGAQRMGRPNRRRRAPLPPRRRRPGQNVLGQFARGLGAGLGAGLGRGLVRPPFRRPPFRRPVFGGPGRFGPRYWERVQRVRQRCRNLRAQFDRTERICRRLESGQITPVQARRRLNRNVGGLGSTGLFRQRIVRVQNRCRRLRHLLNRVEYICQSFEAGWIRPREAQRQIDLLVGAQMTEVAKTTVESDSDASSVLSFN